MGTPTINGNTATLTNSGNTYTLTITVLEGHNDISDTAALPISITLQDPAGHTSNTINEVPSGQAPGIDADSPSFDSAELNTDTTILVTLDQSVTLTGVQASDFTLGGVSNTINNVASEATGQLTLSR